MVSGGACSEEAIMSLAVFSGFLAVCFDFSFGPVAPMGGKLFLVVDRFSLSELAEISLVDLFLGGSGSVEALLVLDSSDNFPRALLVAVGGDLTRCQVCLLVFTLSMQTVSNKTSVIQFHTYICDCL